MFKVNLLVKWLSEAQKMMPRSGIHFLFELVLIRKEYLVRNVFELGKQNISGGAYFIKVGDPVI